MPTLKAIDPLASINRESGFSLTELMIVVFIIGVVSSFILLTAPPATPLVQDKALDVKRLLDQASEEAIISGQAYGAVVSADNVQLVQRVETAWLPVAGARVAFPRELVVTFEGESAAAADGLPDIVFDPIGSASPADLILDSRDGLLTVSISPGAEITVEDPDAF